MSFVIREAHRADSEAAAHVVESVFRDYGFTWEPEGYHMDLYDLDKGYWEIGDSFFVAEVEGEIVGTVGVERFPTNPGVLGSLIEHNGAPRAGAADCELARLYLLKEFRGRGIGKALFTHAILEATKLGTAMEIWSDKRFLEAQELYKAAGGIRVGERICPEDPDESWEWGYVLPLPKLEL